MSAEKIDESWIYRLSDEGLKELQGIIFASSKIGIIIKPNNEFGGLVVEYQEYGAVYGGLGLYGEMKLKTIK